MDVRPPSSCSMDTWWTYLVLSRYGYRSDSFDGSPLPRRTRPVTGRVPNDLPWGNAPGMIRARGLCRSSELKRTMARGVVVDPVGRQRHDPHGAGVSASASNSILLIGHSPL